jgi:hypothetical protein
MTGITFVKQQDNLGRPLPGEDFISGLLNYTADGNLPSGFSTSARVKSIFSVADAIAKGILPNYDKNNRYADANFADATAATGTYLVTNVGANGDIIKIDSKLLYVSTDSLNPGITSKTVNLCTVTKASADSTVTLLATKIAAAINANTYLHGFTASSSTGTVTITAPKSQGTWLNSGSPITVTITGTIAGTLTALSGGTQSKQAIWFYHISEFFRLQPKGQLFLGFYGVPGTYNFTEITSMQNYAGGKIRQIGVYLGSECHAFTSGDLTAIDTEIKTNNDAYYQPLSALYGADLSSTTDLSTLTNLNTLSAYKTSAVIGQDGAQQGAFLYATGGKSITCIGAALGATAFAAVSDDIGWVQKFNLSNGSELDVPAFANGQLIKDVSQSYLTAVDNLRYIFAVKYRGSAGTYFCDSHCAVSLSSDYAYIENNRTIDKANRGIYASLLPALKGPLLLNDDGTLADTTVAYLISLASVNLEQMKREATLSDYQVNINTNQNVQTTGNLSINVQLLGIGVARNITVNIGFVLALTGGQ